MAYVLPLTLSSEGGISLVYLTGHDASNIISKVFRSKNKKISRFQKGKLYLGYIYNKNDIIDEVIIRFVSPEESFTSMESVEINSHGGVMPTKKITKSLVGYGAKEIRQSELIKSATDNKKIDYIQKRALESLLRPGTGLSSKIFLQQYKNVLLDKIDFYDKSNNRILLALLLNSLSQAFSLKQPKKILIAGRSNVGKSTLFNKLVGDEKAIVYSAPGTTRDLLSEDVSMDDMPFCLIDSCGWRKFDKSIKKQIDIKGLNILGLSIEKADLIVYLLDGSTVVSSLEKKIIKTMQYHTVIWVVNKSDLPSRLKLPNELKRSAVVNISALKGMGLENLKKTIIRHFGINMLRNS